DEPLSLSAGAIIGKPRRFGRDGARGAHLMDGPPRRSAPALEGEAIGAVAVPRFAGDHVLGEHASQLGVAALRRDRARGIDRALEALHRVEDHAYPAVLDDHLMILPRA